MIADRWFETNFAKNTIGIFPILVLFGRNLFNNNFFTAFPPS
jgi:hypothetical protein